MFLAVWLLLAGVASGVAPLAAAAARTGSVGPAASFSTSGALKGVAATSATNAWAVGSVGVGKTWTRRLTAGEAALGLSLDGGK